MLLYGKRGSITLFLRWRCQSQTILYFGLTGATNPEVVYVNNSLFSHLRPDLTADGVECIWVEIKAHPQPILVGCIYCPPSQSLAHWQTCEAILHKASGEAKNILLCRDFIVDLASQSPTYLHASLHDITTSLGLQLLLVSSRDERNTRCTCQMYTK